MTTITLHHVSKRFEAPDQTVTAIDDLSLKIASGDVLAVIGPSGCGKSTLLRLVGGLIQPDKGEVLWDNQPLYTIPLEDRGIGMVFTDGALMPHWTARKSVGFFLRLRHREHEMPARLERISQITGFGLDVLMERRPAKLSGGERQRIAVARALMRDPRVFLFDEPFSNIDTPLRIHARVELRRLLNEFPVTSIYVTHDQTEAVALAQRIAVMRAGRLEQVGRYEHLYREPVNLFVATFIGTPTINLIEGYVEGHQWHSPVFGPYPIRHDLDDGERVILGIRPEDIRLSSDGTPAEVESVTPFFSERHALIEARYASAPRDELLRIQTPIDVGVRRGETVKLTLDPAGLLFFDPRTERRIG